MILAQVRRQWDSGSEFRHSGWRQLATALLFSLAVVQPAQAQDFAGCEVAELSAEALPDYDFDAPPPSIAPLAGQGLKVAEIRVRQQKVFQEETPWFKRLANRYHWQTRDQVLREVLPFDVGDTIAPRQLAEAERVLRRKPYLFEAAVVVSARCGAGDAPRVRIDVISRDVWTLNPRLIFTRAGGENQVGVGVSDSNWLGTGVGASIGYLKDEDRSGVSLVYIDPNVAGSRWSLTALGLKNSDGHLADITLERPFYALDTPYTLGVRLKDHEREEGLFLQGDEQFEFDADSRSAQVYAGRLLQRTQRSVRRVLAGLGYQRDVQSFPAGFPDSAPERKFVYPYIAYQQVADQFVERVNLDRIQRTEDIALGTSVYAELGYAADGFGSNGDHWLLNARAQHTRWLSDSALTSFGFNARGRYNRDAGRSEEVVATAFAAFRQNHHERFSLLARASLFYTDNLPVDKQLLLGGFRGLRGYPNRYQTGDQGYLLTLEERFYSDLYPFEMFRLGAAAFVDVGRVWYSREAPAWVPADRSDDAFGTLANVGVGLRLESTRTRRDRIVHIDVAVPLVDGPRVKGVEVTLVAKQSL